MAGNRIPSWLEGHLQKKDLERIEDAVRRVELAGPLEIVPVVVRESSVRGASIMVLVLFLLLLCMISILGFHDWLFPMERLVLAICALPLSLFLGWFLSRFDHVVRWAIPNADEIRQVRRRALCEFYEQKISSTRGRMGVLLFVSVLERRAVVWPDEGASKVLSSEDCVRIVGNMARSLRERDWSGAFVGAIEAIGEAGKSLPHPAEKADELGNGLVMKE